MTMASRIPCGIHTGAEVWEAPIIHGNAQTALKAHIIHSKVQIARYRLAQIGLDAELECEPCGGAYSITAVVRIGSRQHTRYARASVVTGSPLDPDDVVVSLCSALPRAVRKAWLGCLGDALRSVAYAWAATRRRYALLQQDRANMLVTDRRTLAQMSEQWSAAVRRGVENLDRQRRERVGVDYGTAWD